MKKELLRPLTQDVLKEVRNMVGQARHAALAVLEVSTGFPAVSRVALATLENGTPMLLTSELAPHTAGLRQSKNCSLLIGQVGKGDAMAHPRATLFCIATSLAPSRRQEMRERFLMHHPKAINYIDLPDFGFWQLDVERVSYNAGFGKAFAISGTDFIQ